ncbi:MAG TPA: alpha/beta family hydrolase [Methylomirabilota bacterium]|nr:alpha/beta family hydrolase [Methylomirabilota bacterium]
MPAAVERLEAPAAELPAVRGFLHRPASPGGDGLVLTHGAGSDCRSPILLDLAGAFVGAGLVVLRCDLPYRQARAQGPPSSAGAERDRQGLRHAVRTLRGLVSGRVFLGGVSYGGRQASMLAAAEPELVDALLLLSYPFHPPGQPQRVRTGHFPRLRVPALFVHGTRDPFGALPELDAARALIPARTEGLVVKGGHDLGYSSQAGAEPRLPAQVVAAFHALVA